MSDFYISALCLRSMTLEHKKWTQDYKALVFSYQLLSNYTLHKYLFFVFQIRVTDTKRNHENPVRRQYIDRSIHNIMDRIYTAAFQSDYFGKQFSLAPGQFATARLFASMWFKTRVSFALGCSHVSKGHSFIYIVKARIDNETVLIKVLEKTMTPWLVLFLVKIIKLPLKRSTRQCHKLNHLNYYLRYGQKTKQAKRNCMYIFKITWLRLEN